MLNIYVQSNKPLSNQELDNIKEQFISYTGQISVFNVTNNHKLFDIPNDMGMSGFAIFMPANLSFSGNFLELLNLLGEEMYLYDRKGDIVVWNCSHPYCRQCLNSKNLKDVSKNFGSYMQNYFPINTDKLYGRYFIELKPIFTEEKITNNE